MAQLNRKETGSRTTRGAVAATASVQRVLDTNSQRVSVSLRNNGVNTLYVGFGPDLTTANGYPLLTTEEYVFEDYLGPIYIIAASSGDLRYYEIS